MAVDELAAIPFPITLLFFALGTPSHAFVPPKITGRAKGIAKDKTHPKRHALPPQASRADHDDREKHRVRKSKGPEREKSCLRVPSDASDLTANTALSFQAFKLSEGPRVQGRHHAGTSYFLRRDCIIASPL